MMDFSDFALHSAPDPNQTILQPPLKTPPPQQFTTQPLFTGPSTSTSDDGSIFQFFNSMSTVQQIAPGPSTSTPNDVFLFDPVVTATEMFETNVTNSKENVPPKKTKKKTITKKRPCEKKHPGQVKYCQQDLYAKGALHYLLHYVQNRPEEEREMDIPFEVFKAATHEYCFMRHEFSMTPMNGKCSKDKVVDLDKIRKMVAADPDHSDWWNRAVLR
jgi:hypothetical protein